MYLGKVLGDVAAIAGGARVEGGAVQTAVLGIGLVATFAVSVVVARIARRALQEATDADIES